MDIRTADMKDIEDIMSIYAGAREYMAASGNASQWGANYPPRELVCQDIMDKKCYVAASEDGIEAVFYFAIENDKSYDVIEQGQWRNNRKYGVVHRIAVGGNTHNRGVAGLCIDYAAKRCKEADVYDLRMDTHRDNIPMQRFLEKHDFRKCGIVYVENGSERLAYHKVIIKNVVFDVGQVLLEFNWRKFVDELNMSDDTKKKLINATIGSQKHWDEHDRGVLSDEEFISSCIKIEPDIPDEIRYYMENVGKIVKEYDYSTPLMRTLKELGYKVYILSNYGRTPFKYALEHMSFFDEADGRVVSYEVGAVKPEQEIFKIFVDKYNLEPSECVFIDDRADNIEASIRAGMSGIVFKNIEQVLLELDNILGTEIEI